MKTCPVVLQSSSGLKLSTRAAAKVPIIINVNRGQVDSNRKRGERVPVISARRGRSGKAVYGSTVVVHGQVTFMYRPDAPLPCGARVWAEVFGTVEVQP